MRLTMMMLGAVVSYRPKDLPFSGQSLIPIYFCQESVQIKIDPSLVFTSFECLIRILWLHHLICFDVQLAIKFIVL